VAARAVLEQVRRDRPVVLHGVSLGIGSVEPLDVASLAAWKTLVGELEPALVSEHLCWGRAHGHHSHDLWPVPYTEESLALIVNRVRQVQDVLGRRILLENVSSSLEFRARELTEWDFLAELCRGADCGLRLDVNNVSVSSRNHGFDPRTYLDAIPVERVGQFHLAGHQWRSVEVPNTPSRLVVFRQGIEVFHDTVSPEEAEALEPARGGATLPALCEAFVGVGEEAPARAFQAIASWVTEGLVARVDV
jgi:uncharacterized protein (UPF0276 family)